MSVGELISTWMHFQRHWKARIRNGTELADAIDESISEPLLEMSADGSDDASSGSNSEDNSGMDMDWDGCD